MICCCLQLPADGHVKQLDLPLPGPTLVQSCAALAIVMAGQFPVLDLQAAKQ